MSPDEISVIVQNYREGGSVRELAKQFWVRLQLCLEFWLKYIKYMIIMRLVSPRTPCPTADTGEGGGTQEGCGRAVHLDQGPGTPHPIELKKASNIGRRLSLVHSPIAFSIFAFAGLTCFGFAWSDTEYVASFSQSFSLSFSLSLSKSLFLYRVGYHLRPGWLLVDGFDNCCRTTIRLFNAIPKTLNL